MQDIKNLKINLESKILQSGNVVIVPHKNVDFDAMGSAIGIALIVKKLKKAPIILVDDPIYKIQNGVHQIMEEAKNDFHIINKKKYSQIATPEDLFVLTDVNKFSLICLKEEIRDNVAIIDHHIEDENTIKSDCKYINANVSSSSEIISKLLKLYSIKPSKEVANYLLAGIYLDTNKLTKSNVSSETLKVAANLLEHGADVKTVIDFFAKDFDTDKKVLALVSKAQIFTSSVALVLAEEGIEYTDEELAKVVDYLLKYKVDASFIIGKTSMNQVSIKARSREKIDVGEIMKKLDGGGNQFSAATKIKDCTIDEAGHKLIKIISSPFGLK